MATSKWIRSSVCVFITHFSDAAFSVIISFILQLRLRLVAKKRRIPWLENCGDTPSRVSVHSPIVYWDMIIQTFSKVAYRTKVPFWFLHRNVKNTHKKNHCAASKRKSHKSAAYTSDLSSAIKVATTDIQFFWLFSIYRCSHTCIGQSEIWNPLEWSLPENGAIPPFTQAAGTVVLPIVI